MNLIEFESAFKKGLGRCIPLLNKNPDKYRSIVEKYLTTCLSEDIIIEETRSTYMFDAISVYKDYNYFYNLIKSAFINENINKYKNITYLSDLLSIFENYGFSSKELFLTKIREIYDYLYNQEKYSEELNDILCSYFAINGLYSLVYGLNLEIITLIGSLIGKNIILNLPNFLKHLYLDEEVFDEIQDDTNENVRNFLLLLTEDYDSESIHVFDFLYLFDKEKEEQKNEINLKNEDVNIQKEYALKYLEAKTDEDKIKTLTYFIDCVFPLDITNILEDTKSNNKELKKISYLVLSNIKNYKLKEYVLNNLDKDTEYILSILLLNYDGENDIKYLKQCIIKIDTEHNENHIRDYHNFLEFLKANNLVHSFIEILPFMYEHTTSAILRYEILCLMVYYNIVPTDVIEECQYDSNFQTRFLFEELYNEN